MTDNFRSTPPWKIIDIIIILVALNLFGFAYELFGGNLYLKLVDILPAFPDTDLGEFFFGGALQALVLVCLVLVFVFKRKAGWTSLGLGKTPIWPVFRDGFGGGALLFGLVLTAVALINLLSPQPVKPQPFAEIVLQAKNLNELIVPLIMGSVFAPISEELYFRGFVYPVFRGYWGIPIAIAISSLFFASLHFDLIRLLPIALGGAGLAWLYEKNGSIYTPIIAHSVWNTLMTLLIFSGS